MIYLLLIGHVALTYLVVKYINPWVEKDVEEANKQVHTLDFPQY